MTGVIDYGAGNLFSLCNALRRIGEDYAVIKTPSDMSGEFDRFIFPGVGAFPAAMDALRTSELSELIGGIKRPLLGICLGMQVLFERGFEFGQTDGLEIIKGEVNRLSDCGGTLKIPHMGWNKLFLTRENPLLDGLDGEYVYFVHSYKCVPKHAADAIAATEYGERFCVAVNRNNFWGVQFHPEKSGDVGMRILRNFIVIK